MSGSKRLPELQASLQGDLLVPGDAEYDVARRVFNAMIDRKPVAIARCSVARDIAACVRFAREERLEISVRGGGHNVSGKAVLDDGLMIDLSRMKGCHVDPARRVARVEPGLTLAELDRETAAFGLAVPTGIVSPTGVAGLTLGGGIGWLNGKHGLACDNVLSVEIVMADGASRIASPDQNSDLFWAIRGGGGNFGVVASFEFRLHPVPSVLGGGVAWPLDRAPEILRFYREFLRGCPDELSVNAGLFVMDGTPLVGLNTAWIGDPDVGERALAPLRSFGAPLADMIRHMSFVELQCGGDAAFPTGRRHYWKASFLRDIDEAVIDTLVRLAHSFPSPFTMIGLQHMHGASARVPETETAFPHRYEQWDCLVLSQWEDPAEDERQARWTREAHAMLRPSGQQAVYVNDLGEDEPERVREAYGANYDRLVAVKAKVDPENVFRANQNLAAPVTLARPV